MYAPIEATNAMASETNAYAGVYHGSPYTMTGMVGYGMAAKQKFMNTKYGINEEDPTQPNNGQHLQAAYAQPAQYIYNGYPVGVHYAQFPQQGYNQIMYQATMPRNPVFDPMPQNLHGVYANASKSQQDNRHYDNANRSTAAYNSSSSEENEEKWPKGSRVWVGGLPRMVNHEEIHDIFKACGDVAFVKLCYSKQDCYCFVQFQDIAGAEKAYALDQTNPFPNQPSRTIKVGKADHSHVSDSQISDAEAS